MLFRGICASRRHAKPVESWRAQPTCYIARRIEAAPVTLDPPRPSAAPPSPDKTTSTGSHRAFRYRNCASSNPEADRRDRGSARHSSGQCRELRPLQGQDLARLHRQPEEQARRQADSGDGHQPHARGRGQDHHHRGPGRCAQQDRQEGGDLPARAEPRSGVRHEGRRRRRRLCAGRADGRHQSAFHRRLQRHRAREQSARRADRQPRPPRQRTRHSTCGASPGSA